MTGICRGTFSTILHTNTVTPLRSDVQFLTNNVESLCSEKEIPRKHRYSAAFTRDAAKEQEVLLAAQNIKLTQQLLEIQKHVANVCRILPEYCSKLLFDISSGCQECCRRLLDYAREKVLSLQQGF